MSNKYNKSIFSIGTVTYKDMDVSMRAQPFSGDLRLKTDEDAIKQALMILLYTNFGERPFRPNMGGGLNRLLFQQLDQITSLEISSAIRNVIANWEPRIKVNSLQVSDNPEENAIEITLVFSMINISQPVKVSLLLKRVR